MNKIRKDVLDPSVLLGESEHNFAQIPVETFIASKQAFRIWDMWSDPECYTENGIEWMNKYFYSLRNAEIYNAYAEFLGRQIDALKQIKRFQVNFEKELRGDPKQIVPCMISYSLLKNQKLVRKLKMIGTKHPENLTSYLSDNVCKRSECKLYLSSEQFHDYCLIYSIVKNVIAENDLRKEFFALLEQEYPQICSYVEDYKNSSSQSSMADALFTPFLYGWIRAYYMGIENGQINEVFAILYLMVLYNGCSFYGKEIHLIFYLLYRIYCNPALSHHQKNAVFFKKRIENTIHDNMETSVYQNMTFLNFLNELLISDFYIKIRAECLNIVQELGKCKQTELNGLLKDYYGYLFYKSKLTRDTVKSIDEFDQELLCGIHDFCIYGEKLLKEETPVTVQERRKAEACAEKWKSFFLYASEWLSRRTWKLEEDNSSIKKNAAPIPVQDDLKDKTIFALRQENNELKKNIHDIKTLLSSISKLEKEKKLLMKKLEEADRDKKELIGLRNYIYEEDTLEEKGGSENVISDMADFLNQKVKGIIVGGHQNFHNKISRYLPEWKKYPPRMKIPTECITGADIIVFYTDHIDHSTYLSVISEARKGPGKLLYIHNVNVDTVIRKIFEGFGGEPG